jgi:D-glycero-alpha-D-manno-heptose-7-phosphate kinase
VKRVIVARAPTRLDFGGGWTDVPPYPERDEGAVCNIAISRYATATVSTGRQVGGEVHSASVEDDALIRAAIRRSAAADAEAQLTCDFPIGAGLGGSSAAGVALAGALSVLAGAHLDAYELAALSRATEAEELGIPGGFQDHYAAAFGGALLLTFSQDVVVERIPLSPDLQSSLARRGVLVYTGESRVSGNTITAVRNAYLAGDVRVVNALARTKALALEMAAALRAQDLDALGTLVGEQWAHQRALHPSISTPRIEAIVSAAARAGALGSKALGASGGGCVLAIAAAGREQELASALAPLGEPLTYTIDTKGFDVVGVLDGEENDTANMEIE